MSGLWSLMFGWNILHQLLLYSSAIGKLSQYIPEHCHPTAIYVQACPVSKIPMGIIFFIILLYCVGGTDCNKGNMQQMVQQSINHAI
jgi:hypothetical protein